MTISVTRLLIHGASGWLGDLACRYLARNHPGIQRFTTGRRPQPPAGVPPASYTQISGNSELLPLLLETTPDAVLSFTRGETADDFRFHRELLAALNRSGGHYAFCSSFNAVDAVADHPHSEDEPPRAVSHYGRFKERCEKSLAARSASWCAFRFPAIHGYSPARSTRTEVFLQKLQRGEPVSVDRGVRQNRLHADVLAAMICELTIRRASGVFHLGTVDDSEEIDFLRSLASRFGYPPRQVVPGNTIVRNAVMIPDRLFRILGAAWKRTEEDTLAAVAADPFLQKYRK